VGNIIFNFILGASLVAALSGVGPSGTMGINGLLYGIIEQLSLLGSQS
jgi:hypothetical protein